MCPKLISDAAEKFGSQCVVVAIDAKKRTDKTGWNIYKTKISNSLKWNKEAANAASAFPSVKIS